MNETDQRKLAEALLNELVGVPSMDPDIAPYYRTLGRGIDTRTGERLDAVGCTHTREKAVVAILDAFAVVQRKVLEAAVRTAIPYRPDLDPELVLDLIAWLRQKPTDELIDTDDEDLAAEFFSEKVDFEGLEAVKAMQAEKAKPYHQRQLGDFDHELEVHRTHIERIISGYRGQHADPTVHTVAEAVWFLLAIAHPPKAVVEVGGASPEHQYGMKPGNVCNLCGTEHGGPCLADRPPRYTGPDLPACGEPLRQRVSCGLAKGHIGPCVPRRKKT